MKGRVEHIFVCLFFLSVLGMSVWVCLSVCARSTSCLMYATCHHSLSRPCFASTDHIDIYVCTSRYYQPYSRFIGSFSVSGSGGHIRIRSACSARFPLEDLSRLESTEGCMHACSVVLGRSLGDKPFSNNVWTISTWF